MKRIQSPTSYLSILLCLLWVPAVASVGAADDKSGKAAGVYHVGDHLVETNPQFTRQGEVRDLGGGVFEFDMVDAFGKKITIVDDPKFENVVDDPRDIPGHKDFQGFEIEEDLPHAFGKTSTVHIPVYAVADEEYRATYPDWTSRLFQIIETADNSYYRDFQINWVIQGYYAWTSNGGSKEWILIDLYNDFQWLGDGLVIAVTRDPNFNTGGLAMRNDTNVGKGFSVSSDQGTSGTISAVRHEVGHNYGPADEYGSQVCVMNYNYAYSIDYFDSHHHGMIYSRRHWF